MNISTQSSVLKFLISNSLRKSAGSSERSERARDKKQALANRHPLDRLTKRSVLMSIKGSELSPMEKVNKFKDIPQIHCRKDPTRLTND